MAFYLVIFFTDRLILVGEVGSPERFSADVALHAVGVVELLVRLDGVSLDRLLADYALLNDFLKNYKSKFENTVKPTATLGTSKKQRPLFKGYGIDVCYSQFITINFWKIRAQAGRCRQVAVVQSLIRGGR